MAGMCLTSFRVYGGECILLCRSASDGPADFFFPHLANAICVPERAVNTRLELTELPYDTPR
jgi:hypothetical protein